MNLERQRLVLADRRTLMLRALELVLLAGNMQLAAAAETDAEVEDAALAEPGAVIVMAKEFSADTPASVRALRARVPDCRVLIYGDRDPWPLQELLAAGVAGCVLTTAEPEHFLAAIRAVAAKQTYLDPALDAGASPDVDPLGRLSPRERQTLVLIAHGLTGSEVADRLCLSPTTIRSHVKNAMDKLGARTRAHAVAIATTGGRAADGRFASAKTLAAPAGPRPPRP